MFIDPNLILGVNCSCLSGLRNQEHFAYAVIQILGIELKFKKNKLNVKWGRLNQN